MGDAYLTVLRAVHVTTAVFWAGGTFLMAGFHEFVLDIDDHVTLDRMTAYAGVSQVIGVSGLVAVLAGLALFWEVSGGLAAGWVGSRYGLTITVGAAAGLLAFVVGAVLVGLTNNKVEAMAEDAGSGDGLTDEEAARLTEYRRRIRRGERLIATLLLVAVLAMATAEYL